MVNILWGFVGISANIRTHREVSGPVCNLLFFVTWAIAFFFCVQCCFSDIWISDIPDTAALTDPIPSLVCLILIHIDLLEMGRIIGLFTKHL